MGVALFCIKEPIDSPGFSTGPNRRRVQGACTACPAIAVTIYQRTGAGMCCAPGSPETRSRVLHALALHDGAGNGSLATGASVVGQPADHVAPGGPVGTGGMDGLAAGLLRSRPRPRRRRRPGAAPGTGDDRLCRGGGVQSARRPGVGAWNGVVCGLLAVLLLPLLEGLGRPRSTCRRCCSSARHCSWGCSTICPRASALPPCCSGPGVGWSSPFSPLPLGREQGGWREPAAGLCLALAPWAGLALLGRRAVGGEKFDDLWLDFRDRFGVVWGLRVREQFNRSAAHAGWPVTLPWHGLTVNEGAMAPEPTALVEKLRALLKRFGPEERQNIG